MSDKDQPSKPKTTSTSKTKVVETGSTLGKTLQEKQIVALDKARKALEGSVDGYTDVIEKLNNELNDVYFKIQDKEQELRDTEEKETKGRLQKIEDLTGRIGQLEKDFTTKEKDFQVSFDLSIKKSKKDALNRLLSEFSLAYISEEELQKLRDSLIESKEALAKGYAEEIAKVTTRNKRTHEAEITRITLTHEKETAKLEAQNENSAKQLDFYKEQLEASKQQVRDILDNQVEVARAGKGVNINTGAVK